MAKTVVDYLREDVVALRSDIKNLEVSLNTKLDEVNSFRWKFAGGMAVVNFIVLIVIELIANKIK